jgi:hypothetical protein
MPLMSVEELATMTGVSENDLNEDQAEALIDAAFSLIEAHLGRKLERGAYTQTRFRAGDTVLLDGYPVASVSSVTVDGKNVTDWKLDGENGILRFDEAVDGLVEVSYVGGLEEIPRAMKQAAALIVGSAQKSLENGGQTLMSERLSDYQMMYYQPTGGGAGGVASISPAAAALLLPWKNRRVIG